MFGTNRDVRRTRGSLVRLVLAGEVYVEEDPRKQHSGMAMGGAYHCSHLSDSLLLFFRASHLTALWQ